MIFINGIYQKKEAVRKQVTLGQPMNLVSVGSVHALNQLTNYSNSCLQAKWYGMIYFSNAKKQ